MASVFRIVPLLSVLLLSPAWAEDTFNVLPQQAVSIGDGGSDSFMVEHISPNDNSVTVLLRPKDEDCTFRIVVAVGRSLQLRINSQMGQSFLCEAALRPIEDTGAAQFQAECTEKPVTFERKCPLGSGSAAAATH